MPRADHLIVDTSVPLQNVDIISGIVPIDTITAPETLTRLQHHKAILESFGVNELSSLGKLSISGNVVPQAGLLKPADEIFELEPIIFQNARRFTVQGTALETIGGTARLLKTISFSEDGFQGGEGRDGGDGVIDCFQAQVLIYQIRFPCNFTPHETLPRDQTREERIEAARCILEKCQRLGYGLKVEGEDTIVVYDAERREVDRV